MQFIQSITFQESLTKLEAGEQRAINKAVLKLYKNPEQPGLNLEKLHQARDKNFHSIRVGLDIRVIFHREGERYVLCYVDHHDRAYAWAERCKIETHPTTGAAQIVELTKRVEEAAAIQAPILRVAEQPPETYYQGIFLKLTKNQLLSIGVPTEWLDKVHNASEKNFTDFIGCIPDEAWEALDYYKDKGELKVPKPVAPGTDPFDHPDARRRFRVIEGEDELQRALEAPWDKWALFLHPSQRALVENDYEGPTRICGAAGTGKTVVVLHRAVHLARQNPEARVLLTSLSDPLSDDLAKRTDRLIGHEPDLRCRIITCSITQVGKELYERVFEKPNIIEAHQIREMLINISKTTPSNRLFSEWFDIVDPWQIKLWNEYHRVPRLGRQTQIDEQQSKDFLDIFEQLRHQLEVRDLLTLSDMFHRLTEHFRDKNPPFDFIVADEAQDLSIAQMRLLAILCGQKHNGLFLAGDLGQRIFQTPFSWKALGIDIRGRSYPLQINYRTSHQISTHAARLLPPSLADVDGNVEHRSETQSTFNGPEPIIQTLDNETQEKDVVAQWLTKLLDKGIAYDEIGLFVRSMNLLKRVSAVLESAGMNNIYVNVMHEAKGLEFRAVAVMACDQEILPLQVRIENISDESNPEDIYNTERQLLYVASTRAREHLLITGVKRGSDFLKDLI